MRRRRKGANSLEKACCCQLRERNSLAMCRRHFRGSDFGMALLRQCATCSSYPNNQSFNPSNPKPAL